MARITMRGFEKENVPSLGHNKRSSTSVKLDHRYKHRIVSASSQSRKSLSPKGVRVWRRFELSDVFGRRIAIATEAPRISSSEDYLKNFHKLEARISSFSRIFSLQVLKGVLVFFVAMLLRSFVTRVPFPPPAVELGASVLCGNHVCGKLPGFVPKGLDMVLLG
ncbi:hypothetical protein Tco_0672208 [Tanacetum coccineum]